VNAGSADTFVRIHQPQGNLHSKNIEVFLMPTLLADTIYFFGWTWKTPTEEEAKSVLADVFHFSSAFNRGLRQDSRRPRWTSFRRRKATGSTRICSLWSTRGLQSQDGVFATSELNFFSREKFSW